MWLILSHANKHMCRERTVSRSPSSLSVGCLDASQAVLLSLLRKPSVLCVLDSIAQNRRSSAQLWPLTQEPSGSSQWIGWAVFTIATRRIKTKQVIPSDCIVLIRFNRKIIQGRGWEKHKLSAGLTEYTRQSVTHTPARPDCPHSLGSFVIGDLKERLPPFPALLAHWENPYISLHAGGQISNILIAQVNYWKIKNWTVS